MSLPHVGVQDNSGGATALVSLRNGSGFADALSRVWSRLNEAFLTFDAGRLAGEA